MKLRVTIALLSITLLMVGPKALAHPRNTKSCKASGNPNVSVNTREMSTPAGHDDMEGLTKSDWSSIRAALDAHRHTIVEEKNSYCARNPGQQWRTQFDGFGFLTAPDSGDWSWGLRLASYGVLGAESLTTTPSCTKVAGQRVTYEWDEILTEWYINDGNGLEHGYTVHQRPSNGTGPLCFTLAVRGDLHPKISSDGHNMSFAFANGASAVNYSGLTVLDATGAQLPSWFEDASHVPSQATSFRSQAFRIVVDDSKAIYPLTIDPIAQHAYVKPSNTEYGDFFGRSIAISGDTMVVGAYFEDSNATGANGNQADNSILNAGAAYVFVRSRGTWTQQAYLKASNPSMRAYFGITVSISGDTIVVGAPGDSSAATGVNGDQTNTANARYSGAAYVFVRSGTTWSQQAYLKASNTDAGDNFGYSVGVSGDTIVVGADDEDSNATGVNGNQGNTTPETPGSAANSGAAYVFVRDAGGVWSQQAYLKASNTGHDDHFGYSVAVSGGTVVVGADREGGGPGVNGDQGDVAGNSGAAYVFVRSGTAWSQQAYLKASNAEHYNGNGDYFGYSVAVSGDTVVVGADAEDSSATGVNGNEANNSAEQAGAAYVFVRNGSTWSQQAYLKASNTNNGWDYFGWSVAVSGDIIAVGAYRYDAGVIGNDPGAAYLFVRNGTTWHQQAFLTASNAEANDRFGWSVAVAGNTVAVGADSEGSNATGIDGNQNDNSDYPAGAVYVFTNLCAAAVSGDVNGDSLLDGNDVATFVSVALLGNNDCAADMNMDDVVNEFDVPLFAAALVGP